MTGIVVVSHSHALAHAAVDLAREMVGSGEVTIEVAAGLDETTLGTDAAAIAQAIEAAVDDDGAVVLMDLGSAVLSAEMALELLEPEVRAAVVLSPAALVEGLVVAVVTAAGGADAQRVAREAAGGLGPKRDQLGVSADDPADAADAGERAEPGGADASIGDDDSTVTAHFELTTRHGLHARPAARFVAVAQEVLGDDVTTLTVRNLTTGAGPAEADSMLEVLALGAEHGHQVEVSASGPGARAAVDRLVGLAADRFGETD